jgi:hypothetical protein
MTWQFKDPEEVVDYQIDWTATLGVDTIATSAWVVPVGITKDSDSNTTTAAVVWISGGTDGQRYDLKNTITTAAGRTYEENISLFVRADAVTPSLTATIGGASSDSYVTEVEYLDYANKMGWTVTTGQETNLRAARQYLDRAYIWRGDRVTSTQALAWPRIITGYVDGFSVSSATIPQPIKDAQMEMAYLLQSGATPFATLENGAVTRKKEKVDVIEEDTTYSESSRERAAYPLIDGIVADYVETKRGVSPASVPLQRA